MGDSLIGYELGDRPSARGIWEIEGTAKTRFTWSYDEGRERLLTLYQKGKDKQWDAVKRIDWHGEVDLTNPLGLPDETISIYDTDTWRKLGQREIEEVRLHGAAWQFSQFLHGEQGAMVCSARIVESVPELDSKFYAATQTVDEARHAEIYTRFIKEKLGVLYPINPHLQALLGDTLRDSRWDMTYLGMQVLIEGLALAAFGLLRDMTTNPLTKQILSYIMQDEARHVAFGRMALRDYYKQLSHAELRDREDFVIEACYLMRDRFRGQEVWENLGFPAKECLEATDRSPYMQAFRKLLFSRIVPCVKDIGLWSPRLQRTYVELGVLEMGAHDLEAMMSQDEEVAEKLDVARFSAEEAERKAEVHEMIADAS
jgi:hypothetical protein